MLGRERIHSTKLAVLEAIADGQELRGNIVQVNAAEAGDITDMYQACEPNDSLTLFWRGNASRTIARPLQSSRLATAAGSCEAHSQAKRQTFV